MSEHRQHFQQQLSGLENHALGGLDLVVEQLDRVVEALEHQDIERIGDQCVNVAKLIPLSGHEPPVDSDILGKILQMGHSRAAR